MGNSSKFHRGCVNVLSRSWFSSILSFINDDIAIIFEQRHLKSSMFLLWDTTLKRQTAAFGTLLNSLLEKSMMVIAPHSLNFKLDVVLLFLQILLNFSK